ncbi:hypothetical protein H5410_035962 [Solanum commersonii]|uniref:Uncharacterized protein n=1 Tax=Solanum commersonii TaxID=4109 RepID=A0A9J5Y424_SOLCO|nr:hypothetical protein H5410_035962 [Solanum commersonii]
MLSKPLVTNVVDTEEERSLKNHLRWAWLRVKGDEVNIPREVQLSEKDSPFLFRSGQKLIH